MRTSVAQIASLALIVLGFTVPPAQAGSNGCHSCVPTFLSVLVKSGTHGTPNPSRIGDFIGHFDAAGVPQSIVEPSDTHVEIVEGPCEPVIKKYGKYRS